MASLLVLKIPGQREILERHLEHVAGAFRAAGWRVERDPEALPRSEGGAYSIMCDPWLEPLPEAVAALATAPSEKPCWRAPMLPHAEPPQKWELSSGPYTLESYRRQAVVGQPRAAAAAERASLLADAIVAAPPGDTEMLLALGWPPLRGNTALVPQVRVFRYDDPAGHGRAELVALVPQSASLIVDIGCGSGLLGEALRQPGRRIIGIEPDPVLAAAATPRLDEVKTMIAEDGLAAVDSKADVLILADVLEHTQDPEQVLRAAAARLADDGIMIVSLPNSCWIPVLTALARGRWDPTVAGVQARDHLRPMTPLSFRRMAGECGLDVRREIPMIAPLPFGTRVLARLLTLFGARYLDLLTAQWVAILAHQGAKQAR